MSKRSRIITSILTVLFAITAVSALTVYAENMDEGPGGGQSGYSEEQGNQGGNDGDSGNQGGGSDSDSGNQGGGNEGGSGSDYQPQHDYGNDSDYGNNYGNDDDNDSNYNSNYNSYSNRSSNNYDDDGGSDSYYDMDGNRYSNSSDIYVGGDQTYTPPVTIPETTAALYDTSTAKIDNQTLTGNDWKEIQAKLTEASNNANSKDGRGQRSLDVDFGLCADHSECDRFCDPHCPCRRAQARSGIPRHRCRSCAQSTALSQRKSAGRSCSGHKNRRGTGCRRGSGC